MKRRLKILLIYPPSQNAVKEAMLQVDNGVGIGAKPPLGIMYLSSYLKAHSDHDVHMLDAQVLGYAVQHVIDEIRVLKPDIVGINCWTDYWYDIRNLIQEIKEIDGSIHVSLGGPHAAIYKDELFSCSKADSIVLGDGEVPFFELVEAISKCKNPNSIGLLLRKQLREVSCQYYIHKSLDDLPFPDRRSLPVNLYSSVVGKNRFVTTMVTSRGCPHTCVYCKLHFQKTSLRSAINVVDEMTEIASLGINEIEIYDDTFGISERRVLEICQHISDRSLNLQWSVRDRVTNASRRTLYAMRKAGCRRIHYGIESASDATLKRIKKNININQATEAIHAAKSEGMEVLAYFMLGLPGEGYDDMMRTIDYALKLPLDYVEFCITVPYPGTELYESMLKCDKSIKDHWREYLNNPRPHYGAPHFIESGLNEEILFKLRNIANKKFYFRPRYILKQICKLSSTSELLRKSRMAYFMAKDLLF